MNSNAPNLFHYATKELSQDAMICWLIKWAGQGKGAGPEQEELRRCGRRFVSALLNHKRASTDPIELKDEVKTEIHRQDRRIDILALIADKHVLLIEDKTGGKDHSKQLERYYELVMKGRTKIGEVEKEHLHPVYLKTGNQTLADDHRIETETKYKVFHRTDFLNVLNGYEGRNSILLDFRQHLQEMEDQTNSYTQWTRDAERESWRAWEGFYRRLEGELDDGTRKIRWNFVNNPAGGFLGFYWWFPEDVIYLQIETELSRPVSLGKESKLCFKVDAEGKPNDQKQHLKWHWNERILAAGRGRVVKPKRMMIGNFMTVAWWKNDWMAFGKRGGPGKLDMSSTVENLKQAEAVLKTAMSSSS